MTPSSGQQVRSARAVERLYRRHAGDVYRYSLAVLADAEDAEDVTRTTFRNAYLALERGERPRTPHNWLLAIAHNVCRLRVDEAPSAETSDDELADRLLAEGSPATGADVERALSHIAVDQRAALVMRELEGRPLAEIAELLDLKVTAVETLIFRARRALREELESALTCGEAELAVSRAIDGRLPRSARRRLRAHLSECPRCEGFARRQRRNRAAVRTLLGVPLPASLRPSRGREKNFSQR